MANSIDDISSNALSPTDAASAISSSGADWGIDGHFTGISSVIVQSETVEDQPQIDQTYDQKGRLVHELTYDHVYQIQLDVIGLAGAESQLKPNTEVTYTPSGETSSSKWIVRSCRQQGAYNDKKKWSVTLERRAKFPATTSNT